MQFELEKYLTKRWLLFLGAHQLTFPNPVSNQFSSDCLLWHFKIKHYIKTPILEALSKNFVYKQITIHSFTQNLEKEKAPSIFGVT